MTPIDNRRDLIKYSQDHNDSISQQLRLYGAILFRGFEVPDVEAFEKFILSVSKETMGYQDRATPRSHIGGNIFTATDYPPEQEIFLHNESAFAYVWPSKIFFHCIQLSDEGGDTPIADVRRVYNALDPRIRDYFAERQVMYVRNFGDKLFGLPWQTVFQTQDQSELESYCRMAGIKTEWKDEKRLRTRQVRPAVLKHPITDEWIWFNHVATLHVSTIQTGLRTMLLKMFSEEDLPNNTYYGDGTPIPSDVVEAIRAAYKKEEVTFSWQQGDVLMLDNMLVAHGRRPYKGKRKIVVGMADPICRKNFDKQ